MKKQKLNDLKKVYKELVQVLQPEEDDQLDVKTATAEELTTEIIDGAGELEAGELEEMSKLAQTVITELTPPDEEEEETEEGEEVEEEKPVKKGKKVVKEVEEEEELSLKEQIEEAITVTDLKNIIKANDEFESLRKGLGTKVNLDDLMEQMLEILEPKKAKKAEKVPEKKAKKVEEEEEHEVGGMFEMVKAIKNIDSLKQLIKDDEIFVVLRKGLALQNNLEKLKTRALNVIAEAEVALPAEKGKKAEKAEKTPKVKKEKVAGKKSAIYMIQRETVKNPKATFAQLMKALAAEGYPDLNERYVAMRQKEAQMVIAVAIELDRFE